MHQTAAGSALRALLAPRSLSLTGLSVDDRLVTSGALELYGAEFGVNK